MTVTMRLREQEDHQGIYSDKQWQVRLCGPVGLAAKAPVPRHGSVPGLSLLESLSILSGSEGQSTVQNGAGMNNGRGGPAEGTVLGMDWGICSSA